MSEVNQLCLQSSWSFVIEYTQTGLPTAQPVRIVKRVGRGESVFNAARSLLVDLQAHGLQYVSDDTSDDDVYSPGVGAPVPSVCPHEQCRPDTCVGVHCVDLRLTRDRLEPTDGDDHLHKRPRT
jgi:DNA gyrase inhibitor GyrI